MGQSKSKEGKRGAAKKPKNSQPTETSDPSDPNAPKVMQEDGSHTDGESNGSTTPVEGNDDEDSSSGEDELDESIIFSKNKQVVSKDDFELLTVIGKGSFGKVRNFIILMPHKYFTTKIYTCTSKIPCLL
jgi:hypothetical protein